MMGILSFLFGKKDRQKLQKKLKHAGGLVNFDKSFLHIHSRNYFGFYEVSESDEWVVSWADADRKNHVGGFREHGHGRFILYNKSQDKIVVDGKLERPQHGHVANTGLCSIEDWLFGSGLKGIFYVFSPDGEVVIERQFEANLYNSAISTNGTLAVCQTCNAKGRDGNKLTAFDLSTGYELFSVTPSTGWADKYEFDEALAQVIVIHNRVGKFRYDRNGVFLDKEKFESDKLISEDFVAILLTVERKLKDPSLSHEDIQPLLTAISRAKSLQTDNPNGWDAIAFKLEGIALEKLGKLNKAICAYKKALSLNPKIGVTKRLNSLQKKLKSE